MDKDKIGLKGYRSFLESKKQATRDSMGLESVAQELNRVEDYFFKNFAENFIKHERKEIRKKYEEKEALNQLILKGQTHVIPVVIKKQEPVQERTYKSSLIDRKETSQKVKKGSPPQTGFKIGRRTMSSGSIILIIKI